MHQTERQTLAAKNGSEGESAKSVVGLAIAFTGWASAPLLCWYLDLTNSVSRSVPEQTEAHDALRFAAISMAFYSGLIASGWWYHGAKVAKAPRLIGWCGLGLLAFISSLLPVSAAVKTYLMLLLLPAFVWCLFIEKRVAFGFNQLSSPAAESSFRMVGSLARFLMAALGIFGSAFYYLELANSRPHRASPGTVHQETRLSDTDQPTTAVSSSASGTSDESSSDTAEVDEKLELATIKPKARLATLAVRNITAGIQGSGCWTTLPDGQLRALTAAHVVQGSSLVEVVWIDASDNLPQRSEARVVMVDTSCDLALLEIRNDFNTASPVTLQLAEQSPPDESLAWAISYREAPQLLRVREKTIRRPKELQTHLMWEADLPGIAGESGGPLVGPAGLIGLRSGTSDEFSYFTHLKLLREFLQSPAADH